MNRRATDDERTALLGLTRPALAAALEPWIDRPFRSEQIYRAVYERGACDFSSVTGLPKRLRIELADRFTVAPPELVGRQVSSDGSVKLLLRLRDGATIEAVDIPDGERRTLCLSSQAGCALACRFCVTGYWGGGRDLTAGEIVGQVLAIVGGLGRVDGGLNVVMMGMGEPLLNLGALQPALEILFEWISRRRITVSTAGVLPGLEAFARWPRRPGLAVSLHAPDEARRSELMPINRKYPLADLLATLRRFPRDRRSPLTFEYILIDGFNDSERDADDVARLTRPFRAKVNLIPLNPDPALPPEMRPSREARAEAFRKRLLQAGVVATLRRRRGADVQAACGQLRAFGRSPRGGAGQFKPASR